MGVSIFRGPPSGPSVPRPRFMRKNPRAWPWNQPGWTEIAPPVMGHRVRFVVSEMPPPRLLVSQVF